MNLQHIIRINPIEYQVQMKGLTLEGVLDLQIKEIFLST